MLERFVASIPALTLAGVLAFSTFVALVSTGEPFRLLACLPSALLLAAYMRAGRRRNHGGGGA